MSVRCKRCQCFARPMSIIHNPFTGMVRDLMVLCGRCKVTGPGEYDDREDISSNFDVEE